MLVLSMREVASGENCRLNDNLGCISYVCETTSLDKAYEEVSKEIKHHKKLYEDDNHIGKLITHTTMFPRENIRESRASIPQKLAKATYDLEDKDYEVIHREILTYYIILDK